MTVFDRKLQIMSMIRPKVTQTCGITSLHPKVTPWTYMALFASTRVIPLTMYVVLNYLKFWTEGPYGVLRILYQSSKTIYWVD